MKLSTRFIVTLIGFIGILTAAILTHWFPEISVEALGIAAGIIIAYITGRTIRSGTGENNDKKRENDW